MTEDADVGFEVTEYGKPDGTYAKFTAINQILTDKQRESPSFGVRATLSGELMKLFFFSYERNLPSRMKEVEALARETLNETVKYLKKEFKSKMKKALDLKEVKEKADYSVQKVSLNESYCFLSWRFYEIG